VASGDMKAAVLIYTRQSVSDFDRDGRPRGPSLDQQLDAVTRRPEFQGLTIEHFQDANRSGKETSKRPGYLAMLQRIRSSPRGTIVAIGFYDQSRLHRNDLNFSLFMAEMEERGISVYEASGLISQDERLPWKIRAAVDDDQRRKTSRKTKDNLAFLRSRGQLLGTLPVGYARDGSGAIVVVKDAARVIRTVFERYATAGYSFRTLAHWLNARGIKPITTRGGAGRPAARLWSGDVVKEILERPTYAGLLPIPRASEDRSPMLGLHPEIVSLDLWKACEAIRGRNRPLLMAGSRPPRHRESRFPLSALLRCADCGGPMSGSTGGREPYTTRWYACSARRRYGPDGPGGCSAARVHADDLEQALRDWLAKCELPDQVEAEARQLVERGLRQRRTAPQDLQERHTVKELEARLARAVKAWQTYGVMTEEQFRQEKATVDGLIAKAQAIPDPPTMRQVSARLTDLVRAWSRATDDQRARLVASLITEIHVENRRIVAIRPRLALAPYFRELVSAGGRRERETRLELATTYLEGRRSTN
jgi:DNA invertase Pin-like site-specific DNA recombinase